MPTPKPLYKSITDFRGPYRFLHPAAGPPVTVDGVQYPNIQRALFGAAQNNPARVRVIAQAPSTTAARRHVCSSDIAPDWFGRRDQLLLDLVRQKFSHPEYARKLLNTRRRELIFVSRRPSARHGSPGWLGAQFSNGSWHGSNALGKALTTVRLELMRAELTAAPEDRRYGR